MLVRSNRTPPSPPFVNLLLPRSFHPGVCRQGSRRESERASGFSLSHFLTFSVAHSPSLPRSIGVKALGSRAGQGVENLWVKVSLQKGEADGRPVVPPFTKGGLGGISARPLPVSFLSNNLIWNWKRVYSPKYPCFAQTCLAYAFVSAVSSISPRRLLGG